MSVLPENLCPTYSEKTVHAMKAKRVVKRITFTPSEANPGSKLYVYVPKLNENEVLVPGLLVLVFDFDLSGGEANNFLVKNVTWALVDRLVMKFVGTKLQDTVGYDIYKTFEDLFLSQEERDNRILEGIESEDLRKIRSNAGDKKTSGVDAENKLNDVYRSKYRIRLDHQILTNHGIFYHQAFYNDLMFEVTLAEAKHVVKGTDTTKLKYKLTKIQLEYKMIRSKTLADEAQSVYYNGKEFLYDHVLHDNEVPFKKEIDQKLTITVNAQRASLKAFLLLFVEPYTAGQRDSEKLIFPDLTKVSVTVNGSPNMLYNDGIEGKDMWEEARNLFVKEKNKTEHMDMTKFYTGDKFGLVIDMRSMVNQEMHGSGTRIVNSTDGVQLEIERKKSPQKDAVDVKCHILVIADSQLNIMNYQMVDVQGGI
ncbi:uncharacterized protein LOC110065572 [Orbicella faveolata]|uniref:uncharacterized protein LOC110065572 n=1 Tax=Orbicella faveolata TaxID=48498 RepID=UPI0009E65130|nr:uncharacterized protein LOC110065572 [Orbicella faveolata]